MILYFILATTYHRSYYTTPTIAATYTIIRHLHYYRPQPIASGIPISPQSEELVDLDFRGPLHDVDLLFGLLVFDNKGDIVDVLEDPFFLGVVLVLDVEGDAPELEEAAAEAYHRQCHHLLALVG